MLFISNIHREVGTSVLMAAILIISACAHPSRNYSEQPEQFTIAVIPDTQHYLNYKHQTDAGFPFDAAKLFYDQIRYIADNSVAEGGDIVFATSVGDVWEHQSLEIDPESEARGIRRAINPKLLGIIEATPKTQSHEMNTARAGYEILSGKIPFSVAPGNHDYDAQFTDARQPPGVDPALTPADGAGYYGMLYSGGLANFRDVFGSDKPFFRKQKWYVSSFRGGASSAQIFRAAGYEFLHIALEMAADDETLAWAAGVIAYYPNRPTIISTHDFLDTRGQRLPHPVVNWQSVDQRHNSPEDIWQKFVSVHDQIFIVLSGHARGQAFRDDANAAGHRVYQLMANYQDRSQAYRSMIGDAEAYGPTGDGWLRLMKFDFSPAVPVIRVRTCSTYFKTCSERVAMYASWYKAGEDPDLDDTAFRAEDTFDIHLVDFHERFGKRQKR
jgi:hypothetical protein